MKTPDLDAAARALEDFLRAVGVPLDDPELLGTPERVSHAFAHELLDGYRADVPGLFTASLASSERGLVAVRGISYASVCPHHLMPALGTAHVAYLPGGRVVGVGVIPRLVEAFAHRMVLQETLGRQIAEALVVHLGARAAGVALDAQHACLSARGERQVGARVVTHAFAGAWSADPLARNEFFAAIATGTAP